MSHGEPWYHDAVIYAIDVEKFADSDGDGVGDFRGLRDKLWYLEELGVTCVWLLPFYVSPRRDNGYDVADHYRVDPRLGTLDDFISFVRSAGERGIRVMVDIVMDHTSNEHPWFQAGRRDPRSRFRDYYTWEDTPARGGSHGSAFPGEEDSLWTFDEIAGRYYYHPFYSFQPQLDMGNPEVRGELMRLLDYWLSFGVTGFRLDAVPLMLGLDGPVVRPPRDPHGILQDARRLVSGCHPDIALMGEVDLSPDSLSAYFGDGDELNSLLNFILNNYLFLAFAQESARPIIRALRMLPLPPERCQWVNFLRNLDELNIQWLPEEDRHFVWDAYAPDHDMRIFGRGIRRRIAPMLGDRRKLEMAMSLLMALPGTPMLVYGDEIGIGERLGQPGRDSVRVPMQWTSGPSAGFSSAPPERLVRPIVDDPDFAPAAVNVESQRADEDSLLSAVRRLTRARQSCPEIGRGNWHQLDTRSDAVLCYQCTWRDGLVVLAHNMSCEQQEQEIDLRDVRGEVVQEVVAHGAHFEYAADEVHTLTLQPYGYAWYRIAGKADHAS